MLKGSPTGSVAAKNTVRTCFGPLFERKPAEDCPVRLTPRTIRARNIVFTPCSHFKHRVVRSIFRFTECTDVTSFEEDPKTIAAVERRLQRISEAAAKLGDLAPVLIPGQPSQRIRSFGNVLRHEYDHIRADRLFDIVKNDLPGLCGAAEQALHQ